MSTTAAPSRMPSVHWLIESRPPSLTWARPSPPQPNQPPLDLTDHQPDHAEGAAPDDRGVRISWQGALGRTAANRVARCPRVERHACPRCDPDVAEAASGRPSHSLKMCPSDGQD